eukprot:CAMPEP_0115042318 /NCGR_PEP_ID=MMETSP0216-20121206/46200_1 /TAXON_ID=223996 /ORGANISM="Protocruzia adherens, Strain Boccale" /LENGTH=415 /DNA_ID=CAMNT_0002424421 /DNA_START=339 /DNA_END=1586 /DNA_ORIENTATION=+
MKSDLLDGAEGDIGYNPGPRREISLDVVKNLNLPKIARVDFVRDDGLIMPSREKNKDRGSKKKELKRFGIEMKIDEIVPLDWLLEYRRNMMMRSDSSESENERRADGIEEFKMEEGFHTQVGKSENVSRSSDVIEEKEPMPVNASDIPEAPPVELVMKRRWTKKMTRLLCNGSTVGTILEMDLAWVASSLSSSRRESIESSRSGSSGGYSIRRRGESTESLEEPKSETIYRTEEPNPSGQNAFLKDIVNGNPLDRLRPVHQKVEKKEEEEAEGEERKSPRANQDGGVSSLLRDIQNGITLRPVRSQALQSEGGDDPPEEESKGESAGSALMRDILSGRGRMNLRRVPRNSQNQVLDGGSLPVRRQTTRNSDDNQFSPTDFIRRAIEHRREIIQKRTASEKSSSSSSCSSWSSSDE